MPPFPLQSKVSPKKRFRIAHHLTGALHTMFDDDVLIVQRYNTIDGTFRAFGWDYNFNPEDFDFADVREKVKHIEATAEAEDRRDKVAAYIETAESEMLYGLEDMLAEAEQDADAYDENGDEVTTIPVEIEDMELILNKLGLNTRVTQEFARKYVPHMLVTFGDLAIGDCFTMAAHLGQLRKITETKALHIWTYERTGDAPQFDVKTYSDTVVVNRVPDHAEVYIELPNVGPHFRDMDGASL